MPGTSTAQETVTLQYDAIGNILQDGYWNYTWQNGRQLKAMQHGEAEDADYERLDFAYNADGLRVRKSYTRNDIEGTPDITVTDYILHGKNIVHMRVMKNETITDEMHFFYDAQGRPALTEHTSCASGITSTEIYAYIHNLQGDTVGLLDASGNECVRYTYDAWGRMISISGTKAATLGLLQPFRYRGYVYDEVTGLFYLRSRYYNPTWGRFINTDNKFIGNLFMYCNNRPNMEIDDTGRTGREIMEACNGILSGTHSLDTEMLTGETFIEMLEYMVEEQWMYPEVDKNGKRYPTTWGVADCYGIYVACMKAYYRPEDFKKLETGTTCYWAYKNSTGKICIRNNGKLIREQVENLKIGMAVLITHFDDQGHRCYDHIAYVAGFNDDGSVDLIESNTDEHNNVASVRHTTLNNSYVWAIELSGIAY